MLTDTLEIFVSNAGSPEVNNGIYKRYGTSKGVLYTNLIDSAFLTERISGFRFLKCTASIVQQWFISVLTFKDNPGGTSADIDFYSGSQIISDCVLPPS